MNAQQQFEEMTGQMEKDFIACRDDAYNESGEMFYEESARFPGGIVIVIEFSRDVSRCNNGGEYFHYARYHWANGKHAIIRQEGSSYEGSQWETTHRWESQDGFIAKDLYAVADFIMQAMKKNSKKM